MGEPSARIPDWVREAEAEWATRVSEEGRQALRREGLEVTAVIRAGGAAPEIVKAADELRPDLVVVGSQGLSGLARFLLGSVARNVAKHSGRPVLVGRALRNDLRGVVLAIDESENAARAVQVLARLPLPPASEVTVVHVARSYRATVGFIPAEPVRLDPEEDEAQRARREAGERLVQAALSALVAAGKRGTARVIEGDPATAILDLAEECRADLIVFGARGVSAIQRLVVGSVADRLLGAAPCSTLVVP
jgi:nucleotide-binding universal stress UspA family protein